MKTREVEQYLTSYPELTRRWINQCVACQKKGYKPEMPDEIHPGFAAQNLRRYFTPVGLNENGLCEECQVALESAKGN